MKAKKIIILGTAIVICISILAIVWNIKNKPSKSAAVNNTTSSNNIKHNVSEESKNEKNLQTKAESSDKSKDESKSQSSVAPVSKSQSQSETASANTSVPQIQTKTASTNTSESKVQTFTGYITTEDDFAAPLYKDTAAMIHMRLMALSGLGITFQQDGKWVFYYLDGDIATGNTKGDAGKWIFDGTGSQLKAWNIVEAQIKAGKEKSPVSVTVVGTLKGNTQTNPGSDADGKNFPVITVESITSN